MGIFSQPPVDTKYDFRTGDTHQGVAALQLALNAIGAAPITVDGWFGLRTAEAVTRYQRNRKLTPDGVAGQKTQERVALGFERQAEQAGNLPDNLLRGIVEGESGNLIAAVNWGVLGGVDCGYTQRRVVGPPFSEYAVRKAFDAKIQLGLLAAELVNRYTSYRAKSIPVERAWRIAVLSHNWPAGAGVLARGDQISNTKVATWASGAKFADGAPVITWRQWSQFYAIGSHEHNDPGRMCRYTFEAPAHD